MAKPAKAHNELQTKIYYPLPSTLAHTIPHLSLPRPPSHPHQQASSPSPSQPTTPPNPRHAKLQSQNHALQSQILETKATLSSTLSELRNALPGVPTNTELSDSDILDRARTLVKNHIRLLHRYNEIKDVGMGMMGLIAEKDGRRLGDVTGEFGVEDGD